MLGRFWSRVVVGKWPKRGIGDRMVVAYLLPTVAAVTVSKAVPSEWWETGMLGCLVICGFIAIKTNHWH